MQLKDIYVLLQLCAFYGFFGGNFKKMVPEKEPGLVITPSTGFIEAGQKAGQMKSASDNLFFNFI